MADVWSPISPLHPSLPLFFFNESKFHGQHGGCAEDNLEPSEMFLLRRNYGAARLSTSPSDAGSRVRGGGGRVGWRVGEGGSYQAAAAAPLGSPVVGVNWLQKQLQRLAGSTSSPQKSSLPPPSLTPPSPRLPALCSSRPSGSLFVQGCNTWV